MQKPEAETATGTAGAASGASTNGAHPEGAGAGAASDMAAIGDEESKSRGGNDELGGGGSGGNRWPRQETLALLQIRSDMDGVFRDSSHKGPLWDEISRKMADMGYRRSAKKCREKFENVYKYHRRTKDGRSGKGEGKTYRFFDQLEALEAHHPSSSSFLPPAEAAVPIAMAMPPPRPPPPLTTIQPPFTVPLTAPQIQRVITPAIHLIQPVPLQTAPAPVQTANYNNNNNNNPMSFPSSPSGSPSSSSSTSSDEEITGMRSRRKRKWKDFFQKLTKDVMAKQEELERKFLEAIETRENERRIREEAWKGQEIARLKREHEILVQQRSMVSAKESALVSFLQKLSDQQQIPLPQSILQPQPPPPPHTPTVPAPIPVPVPPISQPQETKIINPVATAQIQDNGDRTSSRWPKEEIDALIKLRTNMEHKYQEGVPKGPLWEEISAAMRSLGYNRNAKRCKEKWENINKYYRKVKESNKKRRVDSKTCPYYYQLEALYADKTAKSPAAITAEPRQDDEEEANGEHEDEEDDDDEAGGYEIVGSTNNMNGASSMGGATVAIQN